ncbi:ArsR/SmtB family transcription factor [Rhizobium sp. PAMB 3182]
MNETDHQLQRAAGMLTAAANPKRLAILMEIAFAGERNVGELCKTTGLGQSATSQHLIVLRGEHLVSARRSGQERFYSLNTGNRRAMQLIAFLSNWTGKAVA